MDTERSLLYDYWIEDALDSGDRRRAFELQCACEYEHEQALFQKKIVHYKQKRRLSCPAPSGKRSGSSLTLSR